MPAHLRDAPFLHKSFVVGQRRTRQGADHWASELGSNKRAETMGDAVLYCWVTDWLIDRYPHMDSGVLTVSALCMRCCHSHAEADGVHLRRNV